MAKIKIFGDSMILTSGIKAADLETLKKYKPAALKLIDKETKDELFAIGMGKEAHLGKFGVTFANKNEAGFATATVGLPTGKTAEEKAAYVKDQYGYMLLTLNTLEAEIAAHLETTAQEFSTMAESIQVIE